MEIELSQDEDWRQPYPFLEDHSVHDELVIVNEKYKITLAMYCIHNQLKSEAEETRNRLFIMTFSPDHSNFTRDDDYSFYDKLLKIKWRIEYLKEMKNDIELWQLRLHDFFGFRHPLMYLPVFDRMVHDIKADYETWIRRWNCIRSDVVARAQRNRINEFASLINKKFLRMTTYGVQMQLKPITFKIMLYLFDFHPQNQSSSYYNNNMMPPFRKSKKRINFSNE
jgi:hypothetical protein